MQIGNLLAQFVGTSQMDKKTKGSASPRVEARAADRVPQSVSRLSAGQMFEGNVSSIKGDKVTLSLSNGSSVVARLSENVSLSEGESVFFEVKSNDGNLINIRPISLGMMDNPTILSALSAGGFAQNERNISMVHAMMQEQLPIDTKSLGEMAKQVAMHPNTDVSTLVTMQKVGLPLTNEMIEQFQNYKESEGAILDSITELVDGLTEAFVGEEVSSQDVAVFAKNLVAILTTEEGIMPPLSDAEGNPLLDTSEAVLADAETAGEAILTEGQEGAETAVGLEAEEVSVSGKTEAAEVPQNAATTQAEGTSQSAGGAATESVSQNAGTAAEGASQSTGTVAAEGTAQSAGGAAEGASQSVGNPVAEGASPNTGASATEGAGQAAGSVAAEGISQSAGAATAEGTSQNAGSTAATNTEEAAVPLENAGSAVAGTETSEAVDSKVVVDLPEGAAPSAAAENTAAESETALPNTLASVADESARQELGGLLKELGMSSESFFDEKGNLLPETSTKDLAGAIAEHLAKNPQLPKGDMLRLLSSDPFKRVVKDVMSERWTLSPERVADKESIKDLYAKLSVDMERLSQAATEAAKGHNPISQAANSIQNNVDFINQVNQAYTYIQLPLKLAGQQATGELYVYSNKKRRQAGENDELSAFLHFDLTHLGSTDISVKMKNKKVSTNFFLDNDVSFDLIQKNLPALQEKLEKLGYSVTLKASRGEEPVDFVEDFLKQNVTPTGDIRRYSFDMMA
ncbi:MAG: flagellar hook-length control protein FliK [Lachnospiraceae bacterium]|nr:flagellar hook-length control protein FliK [Lachnospiraceae bacterium]